MEFDYYEYYSGLVTSALVFVIIALLILIVGVLIYVLRDYILKRTNTRIHKRFLIGVITTFIVISSLGFGTMNRQLVFEHESDKIIAEG